MPATSCTCLPCPIHDGSPPPAPTPDKRKNETLAGGPADPRLDTVWFLLAEHRLRRRGPAVLRPGAWMASVRANARREEGDRARLLAATYPDLSADELARVLDGQTEILRYARRV